MSKVIEKANGSTFLEISKTNFKKIGHLNAEIRVFDSFRLAIQPIFNKIEILTKETRELITIRDILINKLIQ